jgi:hypothetical protein
MFGHDRATLRAQYGAAWRKARAGEPLSPLEQALASLIEDHPEYHALFGEDDDAALQREFFPDGGQENPFLHLGLHMALREQVATDRPAGIRRIHKRLTARQGSPHAAEHVMMNCLGQALWEAQRSGQPPDESRYLDCLQRL